MFNVLHANFKCVYSSVPSQIFPASIMSSTSDRKRPASPQDDFLTSMTFANSTANCDCDECGTGICEVPVPILQAVETYKRNRMMHITNYQQRELILRESGVSIWKMTLPPGAEPLRELGGQHRIILITHFPEGRIVKSIGAGIVGSGEEEKGRTKTNWKQASAFFLKSNGGNAVGWINDKLECDKEVDEKKNIVLYNFKATESAIKEVTDGIHTSSSTQSGTTSTILLLLHKYLNNGVEDLGSEDAAVLQKIVDDNASQGDN